MQKGWSVLVALLLAVSFASAAGSSGSNLGPDEASTPFKEHEATTPSVSGEVWELTVVLDDEAVANGSTMSLTTQICTNDGVCDPPVPQEATVSEDGSTYFISLTPPADHTYVNWRATVEWADGNSSSFPQGDWYKVWSSCWYDGTDWGGPDAEGEGCAEEKESPGPGLIVAAVAVAGAAMAVASASRRE